MGCSGIVSQWQGARGVLASSRAVGELEGSWGPQGMAARMLDGLQRRLGRLATCHQQGIGGYTTGQLPPWQEGRSDRGFGLAGRKGGLLLKRVLPGLHPLLLRCRRVWRGPAPLTLLHGCCYASALAGVGLHAQHALHQLISAKGDGHSRNHLQRRFGSAEGGSRLRVGDWRRAPAPAASGHPCSTHPLRTHPSPCSHLIVFRKDARVQPAHALPLQHPRQHAAVGGPRAAARAAAAAACRRARQLQPPPDEV